MIISLQTDPLRINMSTVFYLTITLESAEHVHEASVEEAALKGDDK